MRNIQIALVTRDLVTPLGAVDANDSFSWSQTVAVPADLPPGEVIVRAGGANGASADEVIEVLVPSR